MFGLKANYASLKRGIQPTPISPPNLSNPVALTPQDLDCGLKQGMCRKYLRRQSLQAGIDEKPIKYGNLGVCNSRVKNRWLLRMH
jgi:hypothetical protein